MAAPFTIYKLAILDMLDKVEFPLTNMQISNFFLLQEYTDYFQVQQGISDLLDADLIRSESTSNNTQYYITDAGRDTLAALSDKLNEGIDDDIVSYFEKNKLKLRIDASILSNYYKTPNQSYAVRCQVKKRDVDLIDLTLTVKPKKQAQTIFKNWKKQNGDVYAYLMDMLMK